MTEFQKILAAVVVSVGLSTGGNIFTTNDRLARVETKLEHIQAAMDSGILPAAERRIAHLEWRVSQIENVALSKNAVNELQKP